LNHLPPTESWKGSAVCIPAQWQERVPAFPLHLQRYGRQEIRGSWLRLVCCFMPGQHQRFDGGRGAETVLTQLFHGFWKIKVSAQGRLQQNN
jgi:hypothetical protein